MTNKYFQNIIQNPVINFFNKGHHRSIEAKKNIAALIVIKGGAIAINLALIPMTIHYVNPSEYGIWIALSSIVAWFSFFDIGFGHGLRNRFVEAKATGNIKKARAYVSTTYAVLGFIFSFVWVLFFLINTFLDWSSILNVPSDRTEELSFLALIVFSFFCIQMVLKTINTIIIAHQKPAKAAFFDMLGQLFALVIIFILTKNTDSSLIYLSLGLGVAPILILVISSFLFYFGQYRYIAPSFEFINLSYSKDIVSIGIKFFFIQISTVILFQSTNFIIINLFTPEQVTNYFIAYKYFFTANMVSNLISSPFWSAFTEAYAKKDYIWMKNIQQQLNAVWYLLVLMILIMLLFSDFTYKAWIGNDISIPTSLSILMAINLLAVTRFSLFMMLVNGIGKVKLQLYVNIFLSIIFIPMAFFLGNKLGLNGIILSNIFVSFTLAIIVPYQLKLILLKKAKNIWNK